MSASKNYLKEKYTQRSALEYYEARKDYYILHPESRELLEFLLNKLCDEGEENTLKYIKNNILK